LKNLVKIIFINIFVILFISCITPLDKVKTYYTKGENSESAGNTSLAISYYKTALDYTDKINNSAIFYKNYYKSLIYFKLGNKEKGLKFIETLNNPPSKYENQYLLLKALYFYENRFFKLSLNISELLLNIKDERIRREGFKLFVNSLIALRSNKSIDKKGYKSSVNKLNRVILTRYAFPEYHYYYFNLLLNEKSYEKALEEGFLSLEFGITGKKRKDILYSLKFIKSVIDKNISEKYKTMFRRYNVTDN